jgi:uncharacterized protein YndB with AHSA1/START domain
MTSDNSYTKTLTVAAAPEEVFAALTDPDQVTAWWSAKSTTGSGQTGGKLEITFGTEDRPTVMRVLAALPLPKTSSVQVRQHARIRGGCRRGGRVFV